MFDAACIHAFAITWKGGGVSFIMAVKLSFFFLLLFNYEEGVEDKGRVIPPFSSVQHYLSWVGQASGKIVCHTFWQEASDLSASGL